MALLVVVDMFLFIYLLGWTSIICFELGHVLFGIICLLGLSRKIGWLALIIVSLFLFVKGYWFYGLLPLSVIVLRLKGYEEFESNIINRFGRRKHFTLRDEVTDYVLPYCKEYFSVRKSLTSEQSQLLVLDPELALEIENLLRALRFRDLLYNLLERRMFDDLELITLNEILDKYATEYFDREDHIKYYLMSKEHPLAAKKPMFDTLTIIMGIEQGPMISVLQELILKIVDSKYRIEFHTTLSLNEMIQLNFVYDVDLFILIPDQILRKRDDLDYDEYIIQLIGIATSISENGKIPTIIINCMSCVPLKEEFINSGVFAVSSLPNGSILSNDIKNCLKDFVE